MIKRQSVETVLETAKIEDIVSNYVDLRQRGVNMLGLCPFHDEKTPSFTVSPVKNIYKCFGCGKGGNTVQFLMEHENFNFPEAIRFLAERYNIVLDETERSPEHIEEEKERDSLYIINEYAKDFFIDQLVNSDEGRNIGYSYFKQRGYLKTTIDDFELGYLAKGGSTLVNFAKKKFLNVEKMQEMGLLTRNGFDMYRNRVIFPIRNLSGKVLGFGARTLAENKKTPKYLNSPETEIYSKSKVLYGIYQAKSAIRKENQCFLVEGYTDVLSMHQAGIKNTVSSSGTALTNGQVRLVKRFSENLTLIFDGDAAGIKAAKRGLKTVLDQGLNLNIVSLPADQDPDSFIKERGKQGFDEYVEKNSKDFLLQLMEWNYTGVTNPVDKAKGLKEVLENLALVSDSIKRSFYISEIAKTAKIEEKLLIKEVNKLVYGKVKDDQKKVEREQSQAEYKAQNAPQELPEQKVHIKGDHLAEHLCKILIKYGDKQIEWQEKTSYVSFILLKELKPILHLIENVNYQSILKIALDRYINSEPTGFSYYTRHQDSALVQLALDISEDQYEMSHNWEEKYDYPLQSQPMPDDNLEAVIEQILLRFKMRAIKNLSNENLENIKETKDNAKLMHLLKIQQQLEIEKSKVAIELKSVIL